MSEKEFIDEIKKLIGNENLSKQREIYGSDYGCAIVGRISGLVYCYEIFNEVNG